MNRAILAATCRRNSHDRRSQKLVRGWLAALAVCLGGCLLSSCGGGGGGGGASTPPVGDLELVATTLSDQTVEVPTSPSWRFFFNANVTGDSLSTLVQLSNSEGTTIPVTASVDADRLSVEPTQPLKMRSDYTLTIKAGLKGTNGGILRSDVVRRFRTILLDGVNHVVHPGNIALTNYAGQHTFRIGDVNGDGLPDIVQIGGDAALQGASNSFAVNVFSQHPNHTFSLAQKLLIHEEQHVHSNRMGEIAIIDLDHDDVPEIVIAILRPHTDVNGLIVLKQDAQGNYAVADFIATDYAHRLLIADIDRDERHDLLTIGQGVPLGDGRDSCGMVAVLSSVAGASPQSPTLLPCSPGYEAALGPLDGSGQLHLVLLRSPYGSPAPFQSRLNIYSLDAEGLPTLDTALMTAVAPVCVGLLDCSGLMLMDANGDGIQDLVFTRALIAQLNADTIIYTREAQGSYGEFIRQKFGGNAYAFMTSDLDRDGLDDVVVVIQSAGNGYIGAGFTMRTRRLELSSLIPVYVFGTMNQSTVGIADLDRDGLPDVVLDSYNTGLSVLFQRRH